ncbi:MAG: SGNH/GDSL hydrolase family protein, partial [Bacteroidia bacterium]
KNSLTIITVGSSTTECHLLADDSTWTARLMDKIKSQIPNLWMNNAGINGSSTYGHIILLRDYIVHLKPNYIIFLLGGNEVGKVSFENENGFLINRNESFIRTLFKHSDVLTMISNFIEAHKSIKVDLSKKKNAITNDSETNEINTKQNELRTNYQISISKYLSRINTLDSLCNVNNIKPIFVTHPFYDYGKSDSLNPMSFYNNALVKYCSEKNILFIDLEKKFPKNDPALYYDLVHFNNAGAEKTADILFPELMTIINKRSGR